MYPILGRVGPYFIYTFHTVFVLGLLAAFGWWRKLDGALWALVGGLIGGRIGFVWLNGSYFTEKPTEIMLLDRGGFSYHGVVLGAFLAVAIWCRVNDVRLLPYLNKLVPALVWLTAVGWLACLFEGCAYGRPTMLAWYAADLPDPFGVEALRYQTQLFGLFSAGMAALALRYVPTDRRFGWALLMIGLGRVFISLLRGDPMPILVGLRLDTFLDAGLALIALPLLLRKNHV